MSAFSRAPRATDPIATAEQMRAVDARAIDAFGVPGAVLMESAGRACAERLERLAAEGRIAREAWVLCGPGNNGGDGLVIARTLHALGWGRVECGFTATLATRPRSGSDLALQLAIADALGRPPVELVGLHGVAQVGEWAAGAAAGGGVVVDALFGTGLARPLEGPVAMGVDAVAESGATVFAVDLPSGLDADTGEVLGTAAPAAFTTTLAGLKPGLFVGRGPALVGELELAEIGIPPACLADLPRLGDGPTRR